MQIKNEKALLPASCRKVLLVEDSIVERERLKVLLMRMGLDVTVAEDGVAALVELTDGEFDLVLVDWQLPKLSGLDVCRAVKSIPLAQRPYVIMATGRDQRADLIAAMDAGADDYLCKPVWSEELRVRLQSAARSLSRQTSVA